MSHPSFSIIIPALNEAGSVGMSVRAARQAFGAASQILVVDGASEDATMSQAQQAGATVIAAPRGRARQMNAGATAAQGDVLVFLHADTIPPNDAQALLAHAFSADNVIWGRFDVRIAPSSWLLRVVGTMMNLRSRLTGIATGDQAIFVRRDVFESVGGYPAIPLMEDIALSKTLRGLSRPIRIPNPVTTSARRWNRHGTARTILLMWKLRLSYFLGADPQRLAQKYSSSKPYV